MVTILFAVVSILVFRSQPRRARTQACRSSASVGRSAPTTPRSTSAFIPGSASMDVALPDLAPDHRRDGTGQAGNRSRGIARASDSIGAGDHVVRGGPGPVQKSVI